MDELKIETKRFFKKNSIDLLGSYVLVRKSSPFETSEFELSYDQIENKKSIETKVNFGLLVLSSLAAIVGFLYFFGNKDDVTIGCFCVSILLLIVAFATKLKMIIIKSYDGRNIELFFTTKNKQDIITFSDKIISSSNEYVLRKYSKVDRDLPLDSQLQNLIFLRDRDLLSEEKFQDLKNQLLGRDNKANIGYR